MLSFLDMNPPKKVLATWNTKNTAIHVDEDMKLTKLHDEIKSSFGIKKEIDLFIFDEDFEEYVLLLNMSHIKHMHKILVKLRDDDSELHPPKTVRSNSDHSTWSYNFEVPDFGIVTTKLNNGIPISRGDETAIVRSIFSAVQKFTVYPKSNDYRNITRALLVKYPSLGNTFEPVVAEEIWKSKIIGHFQNNRHRNLKTLPIVQNRSLKKRSFEHPLKPPSNKRAAMHWLKNYLPERESGENEETIQEHINSLKQEKQKQSPSLAKVSSLMLSTFADRRRKVVVEHESVSNIVDVFPWLEDENELLREYSRIVGQRTPITSILRQAFKSLCHELNALAAVSLIRDIDVENVKHHFNSLKNLEEKEEYSAKFVTALLVYFLGEKLTDLISKSNEKSMVIIQEDCREFKDAENYCVKIESVTIKCSNLLNALSVYVASHFVFNLVYCKGTKKFLTYVEKFILQIKNSEPLMKSVANFHSKLLQFRKQERE